MHRSTRFSAHVSLATVIYAYPWLSHRQIRLQTLIVDVLIMFDKPLQTNVTPDKRIGGLPFHYEDKEYYQICENNMVLGGMTFATLKEARQRLRGLMSELEYMAFGWYKVTQRLPHLPVRNTLGTVRQYGDGSKVKVTYTIRKVTMQAMMPASPSPSAGRSPLGVLGGVDGLPEGQNVLL